MFVLDLNERWRNNTNPFDQLFRLPCKLNLIQKLNIPTLIFATRTAICLVSPECTTMSGSEADVSNLGHKLDESIAAVVCKKAMKKLFELHREKNGLPGFPPGPTQTRLNSHSKGLQA